MQPGVRIYRRYRAEDFDRRLTSRHDSIEDLRAVVSGFLWLSSQKSVPAWLIQRLPTVQKYLEKRESAMPVRAVWLTMTVVFFAAGVAKVTQGGAVWFSTAWVFSDHMAISLVQQHYGLDPPGVTWGLFVARHGWLARLMAAGAVVLELAAPLALVSRRLRRVLPPSLLLMQIGIGVLMNVWFTRFMFVYIFWVPWGRLLPSPATIQVNQPNP